MLFKLSVKNLRKSLKDYAVYFLTLILGVAIFYMFNSLDSQKAMLVVNDATDSIMELLVTLVGWASVFVAVVLGFLIVYANNFLIKRRKKEFGLYMTLGMGKRQISNILLFETIFIGLLSLFVGMVLGVFGSQLMSILVGKLFKADMSRFHFVFSKAACLKTCLYFGVIYIVVMLFNTIAISRYKLIDLLTAIKKNEKVKIKNPFLCVVVFLAAAALLGYAYYQVTAGINQISTIDKLSIPIMQGVAATFLIFWSLSGLVLKIVQSIKKIYLRGTNLFVLRQIHNRINTTVVSMTIICLLLFMTISVLSTALSLNNVLTKDLEEMTPVDIYLEKTANLSEEDDYTKEQIADSRLKISDTLENNGFDLKLLKDVIEVNTYATDELTWKDFLGSAYPEAKEQYPMLMYDTKESIIRLSDYNQVAKLYGIEQYELKDNEYIMLCDFANMEDLRNMAIAENGGITLAGKTYVSKYNECQDGYIEMGGSHINLGLILVPDNCGLTEDIREKHCLIANYNADTEEERERIEQYFIDGSDLIGRLLEKGIQIDGQSKISIINASVGLATVITFIGIYLGVIFLIASSAVLALKELTENSDNRQRYMVLRKIGVDEKMIHQSLFRQIGIFFLAPLVLALIHSVFGIQFALKLASVQVEPKTMLPSVVATAVVLVVVYGGYFCATYEGSKNMISEE